MASKGDLAVAPFLAKAGGVTADTPLGETGADVELNLEDLAFLLPLGFNAEPGTKDDPAVGDKASGAPLLLCLTKGFCFLPPLDSPSDKPVTSFELIKLLSKLSLTSLKSIFLPSKSTRLT